jgi:hypothetical protein
VQLGCVFVFRVSQQTFADRLVGCSEACCSLGVCSGLGSLSNRQPTQSTMAAAMRPLQTSTEQAPYVFYTVAVCQQQLLAPDVSSIDSLDEVSWGGGCLHLHICSTCSMLPSMAALLSSLFSHSCCWLFAPIKGCCSSSSTLDYVCRPATAARLGSWYNPSQGKMLQDTGHVQSLLCRGCFVLSGGSWRLFTLCAFGKK